VLSLGKGRSPPPPAQAPPSGDVKVSGSGPTELVRMLSQRACASRLRMSPVETALTQCKEVTKLQQLLYGEVAGWALPHQPGSLASASGMLLAGGAQAHTPLHPPVPPAAPALGQPPSPCRAALRPNPAPAEGTAGAGNPARKLGPTAGCRNRDPAHERGATLDFPRGTG